VSVVTVEELTAEQSLEANISRGADIRRRDGQDVERDPPAQGLALAFEDFNYPCRVRALKNLGSGVIAGRVYESVAQRLDTLVLFVWGDGGAPHLAEVVGTPWHVFARRGHEGRYRASLSAFFGWCVREKLILNNPVFGVKVPRQSAEPVEMLPFSEVELETAYEEWAEVDQRLADILLVLGWTGLRWAEAEARALTVADLMEIPTPGLIVRRSAPEGVGKKSTKGRRSRRVPLANRVLPIVHALAEGKQPGDLLLTTTRGATLHRSAVLRSMGWETTGQGRRIHDLRHTAACLWLSRGVDPGTVRRGWATSRSRRRTGTSTSSAPGPIRRAWTG
jgi:integrase